MLILVAALVVGAVVALVFTPAIRWEVKTITGPEWAGMDGAARTTAIGQFRLAVVQVAAALGAGVALMFTGFNYRPSRHGQVTGRFTKALEPLGPAAVEVGLVKQGCGEVGLGREQSEEAAAYHLPSLPGRPAQRRRA